MNILFVLLGYYFPPNIRVEKEIRTLQLSGHKIYMIARRQIKQSKYEEISETHIHRYFSPLEKIPNRILGGFIYYFFFSIYFPFFIIPRLIKEYKIDALHMYDLPFALTTCILGKLVNRPCIFDMVEDFPDLFRLDLIRYPKTFRLIARLFLLPLLQIEEALTFRLSSKIIVCVEEEKNRLIKRGISSEKISVLWNVPDLEQMSKMIDITKYEFPEKFVITYVGSFAKYRGLETMIMAMPIILKSVSNAYLLLVGTGHNKDYLVKLVQKLSLLNSVNFTGWVPFSKALSYIKSSDICVYPCQITSETNTFPNKLADYMFFGKPIITSNVNSLKRIVKEEECGLIFKANDPEALAKKVIQLYKNPMLREILGKNGELAVQKKYNWYLASRSLMKIYLRARP